MDIIKKSGGSYSAPLNEGSLVHRELMGDHYMLLVFNTAEPQYFRLGDYCDSDYGRFELVDLYEPEYDPENGCYKYNLRLDAYYMKWKNKIVKFRPSNQQSEMAFTLTRDLEGQMELFMSNLAYLGEKDNSYLFNGSTAFTYSIDYNHVSKKMMPVTYDGLSLIDALNRYAEQWECEWWVVDNCIYFGRCEQGVSAADFIINDNVAEMSRAQGSRQYITRLYVFGSERNIPHNYRQNDGELVVNGVVQRRLMLPVGTPYLDAVAGMTEEQAVEGILILDEVYPRTKCKVGAVSTYTKKGQDEEGNETTETFYRVSDTSGFIDSITNDFRLDGDSFHIRFTSGRMNGMDFECNLVADDQRIGRCFEIIANEDYGIKLPNTDFCPQAKDEYIIYGWDATKIADTSLLSDAEAELVTEGWKHLRKSMVDPSEYTCTMISKKMQEIGMPVKYGRDENAGNATYVPIPYDLGDKVNLQNPAIVGSSRSSRIIGYEIKLDIPADSPQFIVGESLRYSKTGSLENKLDEITYNGTLYQGGNGAGGGGVYIIGTGDTTPASNKNVYSAIRSDNQYARKDRNDVIKSLWTFQKGNGARRGLQTDDYLLNTNEGNLFGKGFELVSQTNANGDTRTRLEIDELFVRIKAFFASLEIREMSYVGGNYIFSAAGSKIYYVEWLDASGNVLSKSNSVQSVYTFRCYLYSDNGTTATINKWAKDDQAMCRTFNIDSGVHQNVSNKYYWRRVAGIGKEIIKTRALEAIEKQYLADVKAVNDWQVMTDEERQAQAQALEDLETAKEVAIATVNAGGVPDGADVEAFTEYNYVDISMADCDTGSDYPEDDDTIVQFGNWTNTARQGVIYLQVEGEGAPAIMEYAKVGLQHFKIPDPNLLLSPKKNVIYGEFHSVVDGGGNTGSGDSIADQLAALIASLNDIQNQADKKFELWFAPYAPLPSISFDPVEYTDGMNPAEEGWYECIETNVYDTTTDTAPVAGKTYLIKTDNNSSVNYPASEWTTEALKALHVQDLFYDTYREPASEGGRAWRWTTIAVDGIVIDRWMIVTDQDTLDALEKISDVASDGRLTGGAEKTRVYIDWMKAVQDYLKYEEQARDYGLNDAAYWGESENIYIRYDTAFKKLARLLNGDDTTSESLYVDAAILNGTTAPTWLADLTSTTDIPSPVIYRQIWNNYYDALALLLKAIQKRAKELADAAQADATEALSKISDMASDGKLDPSEKLTVKREFIACYHEMMDTDEDGYAAGILDMAKDANGNYIINETAWITPYITAFRALGTYLNGGTAWTIPALADFDDDTLPSWIQEANMGNTQTITGDTWRSKWADFYATRTAVLTALTSEAQETADNAHERIDDIVSDGIISAGSEKSLLYLDWLKTVAEYLKYTEQAEDYFGSSNTQDDALVTAYTALAKMLNGGTDPSANILNGTDRPAWLTVANMNVDTKLSDYSLTPAQYHTKWNNYQVALTALLEVITKKAKELADAAQADATEALSKISDMASDGKLDPSEKLTVKREFIAAWNEKDKSGGIIDMCLDADNNYIISENDYVTPYINAFVALGTFLNNSSSWSAGSMIQNDAYRANDANLPSWIQTDNMSVTNSITGSTWRTKWSDFYAARTAVMTALSDAAKKAADDAQEDADNALGQLSNLADDDILTEIEKQTVYREWQAAFKEFSPLITQANNAHVDSSAITSYSNAYYKLANYLVDLTTNSTSNREGETCKNRTIDGHVYNYTVLYEYPQMLCNISGDTNISGTTFIAYWSNYYKERSELLAALSAKKVNYFVGASVPATPYYVGDLWLKISSGSATSQSNVEENGEMMVCISGRTVEAADSVKLADWANMKEITEKKDPRLLLAMLASKAYDYVGAFIRSRGYTQVFFKSSSPLSGDNGDFWYDGSNIYCYMSSSWGTISNSELITACQSLYEIFGEYTIKIFNTTSSSTAKNLYDLCVTRIQFTDSNLPSDSPYKTVTGGIEVRMYGENGWEIIQESTRSLIENLGGYVRAVAMKSAGDYTTSAGFITSDDWADLFAQAEDADGNKIAEAHLSAFVTKDSNGILESGVKIRADKIDFQSGTLKIAANNIDFIGKTVINNKFVVDSDGNVTMNNFTANDATIKGNIYTPYKIINTSNISDYATYTSDAYSNFYLLDLSKTGLNIQIDIPTMNPYTYIKLPSNSIWEGAEANIYANGYCVLRDIYRIDPLPVTPVYDKYHPILRKGQKMKLKCIKDGSTYRWIPELYTDIAQVNNMQLIAQCIVDVTDDTTLGFDFAYRYTELRGHESFTFTRLGEGRYKVTKPSSWTGISFGFGGSPWFGNCFVQVNNLGKMNSNYSHLRATLMECEQDYFVVGVADDSSANDGSFGFSIWLYGRYDEFIV